MNAPEDFDAVLCNRWVLEKVLGSGAFGVVYEASDRKTGERVALKMLRMPEPELLKRFKKEFRSLVLLDHENLVSLFEFVSEKDQHFFTMELVDGTDILTYLRPSQDEIIPEPTGGVDLSLNLPYIAGDIGSDPPQHPPSNARPSAPTNSSLLRPAFRQLAAALNALHCAGKAHRDLKPTNILVSKEGRVVLLDFGLVTDFLSDSVAGKVVGTFTYMSPEQARGANPSKASDWYSFGVLLYQALTGSVPFEAFDVIFDDALRSRPRKLISPRSVIPETPVDLNDLCVRLLSIDPSQRPEVDEVLTVFGGAVTQPTATSTICIGRESKLAQMKQAFERAQLGRLSVAQVHGVSGIGKTALVQKFLETIARPAGAWILQTRCYECESVPFKAIDGLIDRIANFLSIMNASDAERLLPISIGALAHIFPVLQGVEVIVNAPHVRRSSVDPQQLRRRAATAFAQLLANLSISRPMVVFIDDLQWGDLDSGSLLLDLMQSQERMYVLLILSFRTEEQEVNSGLKSIRDFTNTSDFVENIEVGELLSHSANELVRHLLAEVGVDDDFAANVVPEAGGTPLVLREFVEYIATSQAKVANAVSFEAALQARIQRLPEAAQNLLVSVALAAQPISEAAAIRAAGIEGQGHMALVLLRSRRFIRTVGGDNDGARDRDRLVTYHDRIREAVARLYLDKGRQRHAALASALELLGEGSKETLAYHHELAEHWSQAAAYAGLAARQALASLAFERAAKLYRHALELRVRFSDDRVDSTIVAEVRDLHFGLAESLAHMGMGEQAGEEYLLACLDAEPQDRFERRRLAAEQFLHSGRIERGLEVLSSVLSSVGSSLPKRSRASLVQLFLLRFRIRLRRLRWDRRQPRQISPETKLRIDSFFSVATGLALVDIASGAIVQASHFIQALRAGEPGRIARALALEGGYISCKGERAYSRACADLTEARELAESIGNFNALALSLVMEAGAAWNAGKWQEAYDRSRKASEVLREHCLGLTWERDTANIFELDSLRWMGRWREMSAKLPGLIADAGERGDLYAKTIIQMHCGSCAALGAGDVNSAREGLKILHEWSNSGFHVEHLIETHNQVEIALYCGDGSLALTVINDRWPQLQKSLLLSVQNFRIQMLSVRARALLSAASAVKDRTARCQLLRRAKRDAQAIHRERSKWGAVVEMMLRAGISSLELRTSDAIDFFRRAAAAAGATDMILHAAAAKRCQGLLIGGIEGQAKVSEGDAMMDSEGIVNREALTSLFAPGIQDSRISVF